jgi:hypothetical protein
MTIEEKRLKVLERRIAAHIPGFRVGFKDQSTGQKVIKALMFWADYNQFISTFYPVVYWPTEESYRKNSWASFKVLAHEYVHLVDGREAKGWFGFSYILPQILGLLALGAFAAFASLWFLFFLAAFLFVLPWPALWRMKWELRGYSMTMAVNIWKHGSLQERAFDDILETFTGWSYYKMWWSKKGMTRRLRVTETVIHNGDILRWSFAFLHVKQIMDMDEVTLERHLSIPKG